MQKIAQLILTFLIVNSSLIIGYTQVAINENSSNPDASAMLDISSTDKGILIPRMDSTARRNILNPATGLMVYDSTTHSFWYFNATEWVEIGVATNLAFTSKNGITEASNLTDDFLFGDETKRWGRSGFETKFFFDNENGALRAGVNWNPNWDEENIGYGSIALGDSPRASNTGTIALGSDAQARGYHAMAFGYGTQSSGNYSTTFGTFSAATGVYSNAFGFITNASSFAETVMGLYNTSAPNFSQDSFEPSDRLFVLGNGKDNVNRSDAMIVYKSGDTEINGKLTIDGNISADNLAFTSENSVTSSVNNDDDFVFGADSLNYGTGRENKFFFDKTTGAFRAGAAEDQSWDQDSLGAFSVAIGLRTKATASHSFATGIGSIASGNESVAMGAFSEATGITAVALGNVTKATGNFSFAQGSSATAIGASSSAIGAGVTSEGSYSAVQGFRTKSYSFAENVIGAFSTDYTPLSKTSFEEEDRLFVIGNGTSGNTRSDALRVYKNGNMELNGALTIDSAYTFPVVDGTANQYLTTNGNGTLSWTNINPGFISTNGVAKASNITDDFLVGDQTLNHGGTGTERKMYFDQSNGALRAGYINNTDWNSSNVGTASVALGYGALANKDYSVALGFETESVGAYAMATGFRSRAAGQYSVAMGLYNYARSYGEVAIGTYNTDYTANSINSFDAADRLFVIGNGTANNARSDAFIVYKSGNTRINGNTTFNGNLLGANGTVIVNDNLRVNGNIVSNNGTVTVNDELLVRDSLRVESSGIGEHDFIATFENTADDNSDRNNGIEIIAGHTSYDSDYKSTFARFTRPDGQQCGRVRQDGGSAVRYVTSSDIRLKENIKPTQYGLQDILNIQVRDYNFITDKDEHQQTGFIAQQLHTVFPTAVQVGSDDVKNDPWTVDYGSLTPLLVKGIQDQQQTIEDLEATVINQQLEIESLKAQIAKIERLEALLHQLQAQVANPTISDRE